MFPPLPFRVYIHLGAAGGNNMLPIHRRREGPLPPSLPPPAGESRRVAGQVKSLAVAARRSRGIEIIEEP